MAAKVASLAATPIRSQAKLSVSQAPPHTLPSIIAITGAGNSSISRISCASDRARPAGRARQPVARRCRARRPHLAARLRPQHHATHPAERKDSSAAVNPWTISSQKALRRWSRSRGDGADVVGNGEQQHGWASWSETQMITSTASLGRRGGAEAAKAKGQPLVRLAWR